MKHTREDILAFLKVNKGRVLSGGAISRRLGISRAAVWKHICRLREQGYIIEAGAGKGYLLIFEPEQLRIERIRTELKPVTRVRQVFFFPSLDSTNRKAYDLALEGAPEGTIILAEEQSAGRGRLGRSWSSLAYHGLWLSALLRPANMTPGKMAPFTAAAAAIMAAVLRKVSGLPVSVKWPNDLLINDRKLGGILAEAKSEPEHIHFMILGIGININHKVHDFPAELAGKATSLRIEGKRLFDREAICVAIIKELEAGYDLFLRSGFSAFLELWRELDIMPGKEISVKFGAKTIHGTAVDIDKDGALIVKDSAGRLKRFSYGEIEHLKTGLSPSGMGKEETQP